MPLISAMVNKQETKPNDLADLLLVQQSILMLESKAKKNGSIYSLKIMFQNQRIIFGILHTACCSFAYYYKNNKVDHLNGLKYLFSLKHIWLSISCFKYYSLFPFFMINDMV